MIRPGVPDADPGEAPAMMPEAGMALRIGEAAARSGVSPRTLRWYEELGMLVPSGHTAGGARRYGEEDLARVFRIRELQSLLGFDLDEIGGILKAEDDLAVLRNEYRSGGDMVRRRQVLAEAIGINDGLRAVVAGKQQRLADMLAELDRKATHYRSLLDELDQAPH